MKDDATRRHQPAQSTTHVRRASLRATSFVAANGSFTAVIATNTPVRRHEAGEDYLEVLQITPKSIRMDRLKSGSTPILDSHRSTSARDQIGLVRDARIEHGKLVVEAALSAREDVQPIAADFVGGTPANVSVGYRVYASEQHRNSDGMLVVTRTDWEPFEVSLVAIPADPNAHVRTQQGNLMTVTTEAATTNESHYAPSRSMSDVDIHTAYEMANRHAFSLDQTRQHIQSGGTLDQFRGMVLDQMAARSNAASITSRHGSDDTFDNPDFLSRAIEDALYSRMSGAEPTAAAREFAGRSLLQIGETILQARGERVSWRSRDNLAGRILSRDFTGGVSISDFPTLLSASGNRVLQDAYLAAQSPIKKFARHRDANDFRPLTTAKVGNAPELKMVLEGGEVTHGGVSETKESFRLATYARIFGVTRQAIINDDLHAFTQVNESWGQAAANLEAEQLVALLTVNSGNGASLDDGNPLYTTARKNKAAAGDGITIAAMDAARRAMRGFTGLDGKLIGTTPKHLVVGPAKETEAMQFVATGVYPTSPATVNPFVGSMEVHVEPRITGNSWRLFSDDVPALVMAHLAGGNGPQIDTMPGWTTLGVEFRCVLDFGCGIQDWRGTYLNPGD